MLAGEHKVKTCKDGIAMDECYSSEHKVKTRYHDAKEGDMLERDLDGIFYDTDVTDEDVEVLELLEELGF